MLRVLYVFLQVLNTLRSSLTAYCACIMCILDHVARTMNVVGSPQPQDVAKGDTHGFTTSWPGKQVFFLFILEFAFHGLFVWLQGRGGLDFTTHSSVRAIPANACLN